MERSVTVGGRTVALDEAGDGPGLPLALVHGFGAGRDEFAEVVDELAADRRVVALDLPGHGGSQGPDDPTAYTLDALAGWVLEVLSALSFDDFHLLGHALGGLVAQRAAAAASERLRSLVLAGTGLGALREDEESRVVRAAIALRDADPQAALAAGLDGLAAPGDRARLLGQLRRVRPVAGMGLARGLLAAEPLGAFLRGIDVPVLVVHGDADPHWTPAEQRLLAATIAGARRVVVPGSGHRPHRDRPHAWLAAVRPFLRAAESR